MHLETWDRTNLQEQENTFGRYKESGAPFGKTNEFDEVDLSNYRLIHMSVWPKKSIDRFYGGLILIQMVSMNRLGQFDAGLIFIAFQKDPNSFVKIQTNLGASR